MNLPVLFALTLSVSSLKAELFFYAGSYTNGGSASKGITLLALDETTGAITVKGTAAESSSPSFLALNADASRLYAVNEDTSHASAFSIDPKTHLLTELSTHPVSPEPDQGPCHLAIVKDAGILVTGNYSGGSVSVFPIREDGSLAPHSLFIKHQKLPRSDGKESAPKGHSSTLSPDGKYVLVNDLGNDRVYVYQVDTPGKTLVKTPVREGVLKTGAGPRHGAFDPSGRIYYCLNESDSTITSFTWGAATASLTATGTISTLPRDFTANNSTAEIMVHPSEKVVYASNRGHDSIVVCGIDDAATGKLSVIQHMPAGGKTPRNFTLSPDGRWLLTANQSTNNIAVFSIDPENGKLKSTRQSAAVGKPVCLIFLPRQVK